MKPFKDYMNCHEGATAFVAGKGPSLEYWKQAGFGKANDVIVFGVNDVANIAPVDYTFSTDGYLSFCAGKIESFIALPYRNRHKDANKWSFRLRKGHDWFLHCHDVRRMGYALRQTKEQLADTRHLYTCSSSVQPAIHFAWYTGCTELILIGVDGGGGHHDSMKSKIGPDTNQKYHRLRQETVAVANMLYGKNWQDYATKYSKYININQGLLAKEAELNS